MSPVVHASTVIAVLDGFSRLGLEVESIRRDLALAEALENPDSVVPIGAFETVWQRGLEQRPVPELAIEVGLHVPLGAFGAMDYLAVSADKVDAAFRALAAHFTTVVPGRWIEIADGGDGYRISFHCKDVGTMATLGDDFTVAIVISHFRAHTAEFPVSRVELTREEPPNPRRFSELLQAPVTFQHSVAALELPRTAAELPLTSHDPLLHRTLHTLTSRLGLSDAQAPLEVAIRRLVREHLPGERLDAQAASRKLGMSERSLHRKLSDAGRTYQDVVESVLRQEAERLLQTSELGLAEVALLLGFADQSAFSRAFKRWTNSTPSQWRAARRESRPRPR